MAENEKQHDIISPYTTENIEKRKQEDAQRTDELVEQLQGKSLQEIARMLIARERNRERSEKKGFIDPLTQIYNRRFFNQQIEREAKEAERRTTPLRLVMLDLDNFGSFNKKYGQQMGDKVLYTTAQKIQETVRETDYVCRVGGEELAVIMPYTNDEQRTTPDPAERIRQAIETMRIEEMNETITASVGTAIYEPGETTEAFFTRTAKAMKDAKKAGKNRTFLFEERDENGRTKFKDITNNQTYIATKDEYGETTLNAV